MRLPKTCSRLGEREFDHDRSGCEGQLTEQSSMPLPPGERAHPTSSHLAGGPSGQRYTAGRRRGLRGLLSPLRGVVRDGKGREVVQARSPKLAVLLADALNGELVPNQTDPPSGLPRYFVASSPSNPQRQIVSGVHSTIRNPARFGNGYIARTEDAELAGRLCALMNELDPENLKRVTRGFGWF